MSGYKLFERPSYSVQNDESLRGHCTNERIRKRDKKVRIECDLSTVVDVYCSATTMKSRVTTSIVILRERRPTLVSAWHSIQVRSFFPLYWHGYDNFWLSQLL